VSLPPNSAAGSTNITIGGLISLVGKTPAERVCELKITEPAVQAMAWLIHNKLTIVTRIEWKGYFDRYLIEQSGKYRFEDLIAQAKQKLVGLDDFALAAHFKAVEDLPNLEEFQESYMLVKVDPRELVSFFQEWARRLFAIVG